MDVKATVGQLVRLQEVESGIAAVKRDLEKGPQLLREIEASAASARTALAAAKAALDLQAKERRASEQSIEEIKTKIARHKNQMVAVKTNQEYRALTSEIEHETALIEQFEDRILMSLERSDELGRVAKEKEALLGVEERRISEEAKTLASANARLDKELADFQGQLGQLSADIPKQALALYRRISDVRGEKAMSRVDGESCGECRIKCRPQTVSDVRLFEGLVQCDNCSRILFGAPAPPKRAEMTEREVEDDDDDES